VLVRLVADGGPRLRLYGLRSELFSFRVGSELGAIIAWGRILQATPGFGIDLSEDRLAVMS